MDRPVGSGPRWPRVALIVAVLGLAGACAVLWQMPGQALDWREALATCERWRDRHPLGFALGFATVFATLSAVSLPGCSVMALLAGPLFGGLTGTLLLGLASTVGATLPFLVARHLAREAAQARFGHRLQDLERMLVGRRGWRLAALRLVPMIPYPVLNPLLGLTHIRLREFLVPSFLGLTLGSAPWACLGASAHQAQAQDLASAMTLAAAALLLLATAGWAGRRVLGGRRR